MSAALLRRIERFLHSSGMSPTRFGREVSKDPRLLKNMRNGRQIGEKLEAKIEAFIKANS